MMFGRSAAAPIAHQNPHSTLAATACRQHHIAAPVHAQQSADRLTDSTGQELEYTRGTTPESNTGTGSMICHILTAPSDFSDARKLGNLQTEAVGCQMVLDRRSRCTKKENKMYDM